MIYGAKYAMKFYVDTHIFLFVFFKGTGDCWDLSSHISHMSNAFMTVV